MGKMRERYKISVRNKTIIGLKSSFDEVAHSGVDVRNKTIIGLKLGIT